MGLQTDLTGKMIAGRYQLTRLLGQGGMGAVWAAIQTGLDREVALKVIRADLSRDPQAIERFKREAKVVSQLMSPHIVTVFDFGEADDGSLFIAMELLQGTSLRDRLERGAMTPRESSAIVKDICAALSIAHSKGIVHRDLKPDNVMLVDSGGRKDFVKLLDFGVAKLLDKAQGAATLTGTGMLVGTPGYLAPEVVLTGVTNDQRSDLYALGVMWFEMLAGQPLFTAPTPMALVMRHATERPPRIEQLNHAIPGPLADLIDQLLAKDPSHRPATAEAVMAHIDAMLGNLDAAIPASLLVPPRLAPTEPTVGGTMSIRSIPSGPMPAPLNDDPATESDIPPANVPTPATMSRPVPRPSSPALTREEAAAIGKGGSRPIVMALVGAVAALVVAVAVIAALASKNDTTTKTPAVAIKPAQPQSQPDQPDPPAAPPPVPSAVQPIVDVPPAVIVEKPVEKPVTTSTKPAAPKKPTRPVVAAPPQPPAPPPPPPSAEPRRPRLLKDQPASDQPATTSGDKKPRLIK